MSTREVSVLLVEDNYIVRKMGVILLKQLNCKVDVAETGTQALELASRVNYDIIFMDIGLPDINGLSIISHIRTTSGLNHQVPIIALTAHSDKQSIKESFDVGATDYYVKPLNDHLGRELLERYT
jgi:two-component system aerobic respiration control sensor histidine kinase ArcB